MSNPSPFDNPPRPQSQPPVQDPPLNPNPTDPVDIPPRQERPGNAGNPDDIRKDDGYMPEDPTIGDEDRDEAPPR